jgi:hypothetical protein
MYLQSINFNFIICLELIHRTYSDRPDPDQHALYVDSDPDPDQQHCIKDFYGRQLPVPGTVQRYLPKSSGNVNVLLQ